MKIKYFVLLLFCGICSCHSSKNDKTITPAFYYWKSTFRLDSTERQTLNNTHTKKLYVKFFDVDMQNAQIQPQAVLTWKDSPPQSVEVVPVVFITNRTLRGLSSEKVETLAMNIVQKIEQIAQIKQLSYHEIQLDCDWSPTTRRNYFHLLSALKKHFQGVLSCTIRLHQIKFWEQTGVPPVHRGMLMCYNMADWKNPQTRNSIFDEKILNQYLDRMKTYPLDLDVVMPLFRWTVLYRNGRFVVFKNYLDKATLEKCTFVSETIKNNFVVQQDTAAWGLDLRKGDLLRSEAVAMTAIHRSKKYVLQRIKQKKLTFAYYHLDTPTLIPYRNEKLF